MRNITSYVFVQFILEKEKFLPNVYTSYYHQLYLTVIFNIWLIIDEDEKTRCFINI